MQAQQQPGHQVLAEVGWWVGGYIDVSFPVAEATGYVLDGEPGVGCGFLCQGLVVGLSQRWGLHPDSWVGLKCEPPVEQCYLLCIEVEGFHLGRFWQEDVKPHPLKVVSGFGLPPEPCQGVLSP